MTPLDCKSAREHLHDHVSGELSSAPAGGVQSHLDACPDCTQAFARFKNLRGAVKRAASTEPVPATLKAQVLQSLRAAPARAGWLDWLRRPAFVMALLLLAV